MWKHQLFGVLQTIIVPDVDVDILVSTDGDYACVRVLAYLYRDFK